MGHPAASAPSAPNADSTTASGQAPKQQPPDATSRKGPRPPTPATSATRPRPAPRTPHTTRGAAPPRGSPQRQALASPRGNSCTTVHYPHRKDTHEACSHRTSIRRTQRHSLTTAPSLSLDTNTLSDSGHRAPFDPPGHAPRQLAVTSFRLRTLARMRAASVPSHRSQPLPSALQTKWCGARPNRSRPAAPSLRPICACRSPPHARSLSCAPAGPRPTLNASRLRAGSLPTCAHPCAAQRPRRHRWPRRSDRGMIRAALSASQLNRGGVGWLGKGLLLKKPTPPRRSWFQMGVA